MADWARLTVSHFCTQYFKNEEFCISGRSHFLGDFSRSQYCWKTFQQDSLPRSRITPRNPSRNFWSCSLYMSERFTVVWVGTCYLLIQIFGHFILSKCTSSNTAPSVSCETKKFLDAWLFTGGTPYLPPRERPPNDVCLYLGWEIQSEWHHWNHYQLQSFCQLVSVVCVVRSRI